MEPMQESIKKARMVAVALGLGQVLFGENQSADDVRSGLIDVMGLAKKFQIGERLPVNLHSRVQQAMAPKE